MKPLQTDPTTRPIIASPTSNVAGGVLPISMGMGPRAEVPDLFKDPIRAMRQFLEIYEKEGPVAAQAIKDFLNAKPTTGTPYAGPDGSVGGDGTPGVAGIQKAQAKFRCVAIKAADGQNVIEGATVTFFPVSGGSPENEQFYRWTPGGTIELSTVNGNVAQFFVVGTDYYVDFTPAASAPTA